MKRNLIAALALMAGMAFANASHAGTVLVSESFTATGASLSNSVSSITFNFTGLNGISDISFAGVTVTNSFGAVTPSFSSIGQSVTISLNPSAYLVSGVLSFQTQTANSNLNDLNNTIKLTGYTVVASSSTVTTSSPTFNSVAAVPEPTSSAMFGIGVVLAAGFGWNRKRRELAKLAA